MTTTSMRVGLGDGEIEAKTLINLEKCRRNWTHYFPVFSLLNSNQSLKKKIFIVHENFRGLMDFSLCASTRKSHFC